MKNLFFVIVPLFSCICGCSTNTGKTDLLAFPGLEVQSEHFPGSTFMPYSKMIVPAESGWLVKNPSEKTAVFAVLKGITLDPDGIYELRMRYVGREKTRLFINGAEYKNGSIFKKNILLNTVSFLNVNGPVEYRKVFAVNPDCEQLVPVLSLINAGKKGHATEFLIEDLSVHRIGTMKKASDKVKKVNSASEYDFSNYPLGSFDKIHKGDGANAKKWSDVKAEIVNLNGEKVLHIVRKPENYIYPFIEMKPFTVDPQYHFVKLTFKAKGTGSITPGLWWKRPALSWDYYHGESVKLTGEWQTVTLIHPCLTPGVESSTVSFTSSGHGEFWIKDIFVGIR
ncbi:MAG: hypothetical protein IKD10_11160 [Lentisphaeria bacterium]|nr:hypothetical protein [Lentisphaeria bacterium]